MARPNETRLIRDWRERLAEMIAGRYSEGQATSLLRGMLKMRGKPQVRLHGLWRLGFEQRRIRGFSDGTRGFVYLVEVDKLIAWLRENRRERHAVAIEQAHALLLLGVDANSTLGRQDVY